MTQELAERSINTIRGLAIDAIEKANSGHPGLPMGAAPMAYVLWQNHLRHNPSDSTWIDRDRFVLSAGHGSMLLYSLLHLTGYPMTLDDLRAFRQWESVTPGHPESFITSGVECTTGPLGQGCGNAVGMALAECYLGRYFNRPGHTLIDHHTYALVGDGDLMEGVSAEASELAGHLGLGKLIMLYDANDVTLDGPTSLCFSADVGKRYESYGFHVVHVSDGDRDLAAIDRAIEQARAQTERPSLIIIKTTIGFGSPTRAGTCAAHGQPLGAEEAKQTKAALGLDPARVFDVPASVAEHMGTARARGAAEQARWTATLDSYRREFPRLAAEWDRCQAGELIDGWEGELPSWRDGKIATRSAGGKVLNAIAAKVPWLLGGDADLGGSTKTIVEGGDFDNRGGRNVRFGVREHAMAAVANGLAYHGGVRAYTATFFVFSDYMRPSLRLAAMNNLPVVHVWTHDSIALGEDGPTHQPIEHLMALRAVINLSVVRPCDANETAEAWRYALRRKGGPTGLVLSRQDLPVLARGDGACAPASGLARGAYVIADGTDALIIASGAEVALALDARALLARQGVSVRVVSMPCWSEFERQGRAYHDEVLPPAMAARVSVEAGVTFGWSRWIGADGIAIGIDRYGASAPGEVNMQRFGFTADNIATKVREALARVG